VCIFVVKSSPESMIYQHRARVLLDMFRTPTWSRCKLLSVYVLRKRSKRDTLFLDARFFVLPLIHSLRGKVIAPRESIDTVQRFSCRVQAWGVSQQWCDHIVQIFQEIITASI